MIEAVLENVVVIVVVIAVVGIVAIVGAGHFQALPSCFLRTLME